MRLDKEFVGKKLKEYRKKSKLTQEEVSQKAEIDEKHYGKLERGIFNPSLETFFKLVKILNIPLVEFDINEDRISNKEKENLLKEIQTFDDDEIGACGLIFSAIKKLRQK